MKSETQHDAGGKVLESAATYIHGTTTEEQDRLALLNRLTNPPFITFLHLQQSDRVLEIGSGLGILAAEVAQILDSGFMVGVEFAAAQLHAARRAHNLYFCRGDAHALPLSEESFDVVYCRYLLEHVADPVQVLREAKRVLRAGGRVYLQENNIRAVEFYPECPAFSDVWRRFVELQARLGGDALIGRRLLPLLQQAGFTRIELSVQPEVHYSGLSTFASWVENIARNVEGATEKLVSTGLASRQEVQAATAELRALMQRRDGSAFFYWNRARARK